MPWAFGRLRMSWGYTILLDIGTLFRQSKMRKEAQFFNYREKYILNSNGKKEILQVLVCRKPVFNPHKNELYHKWDNTKTINKSAIEEVEFLPGFDERTPDEIKGFLHSIARENKDNRERAQRRARAKVFDYIIANEDLQLFCTLTLDKEKINRKDYGEIIKKFNTWTDNQVRRNGLKYVAVPELHKDGAVHFHLLTNKVIPLICSGTYLPPDGYPGKRKPLKADTLIRKGYTLEECQEVYNIPGWKYGFTSAMIIQGERKRVANYIAKYITKTLEKVGGRYYLHGGALQLPCYEYDVVNWDDFVNEESYTFEVPGNEYAIIG